MNTQPFHITKQGASHIKINKECQDASASYKDEKVAIAVVCDGHGGDDYVRSAIGSQYGCDIAVQQIRQFVDDVNIEELIASPERLIKPLQASIIAAWDASVHAHYDANPFLESELAVLSEKAKRRYLQENRIEVAYGTTMIAVVVTARYWFGIHIGDGKCIAVNPAGMFKQPIPWDEKCFLNATTSICDTNALEHFRYFFSEKLPVAVFIGSDGIDDCFPNNDRLNGLYKTILYSFSTENFDDAVEGLAQYLPRLSEQASGDDMSIAAILDMDNIAEIPAVKEFSVAAEQKKIQQHKDEAQARFEEERRRVDERIKREKGQDIHLPTSTETVHPNVAAPENNPAPEIEGTTVVINEALSAAPASIVSVVTEVQQEPQEEHIDNTEVLQEQSSGDMPTNADEPCELVSCESTPTAVSENEGTEQPEGAEVNSDESQDQLCATATDDVSQNNDPIVVHERITIVVTVDEIDDSSESGVASNKASGVDDHCEPDGRQE